jgi:hypothetical protein
MKKVMILALPAVLIALTAVLLLAQNKDLSGTWVGETVVPNSADKDGITLVLKKDGSSYSGTFSDSMGMANSVPLENVKFENDTLTFEFVISTPDFTLRVSTTLKISGEKLVGSWVTESNESGSLELSRKKSDYRCGP